MVTLRTGKASSNVVMGVHKPNGELRWLSINSLPLRADDENRPHGVITTFHDITVMKTAQSAAERPKHDERVTIPALGVVQIAGVGLAAAGFVFPRTRVVGPAAARAELVPSGPAGSTGLSVVGTF